MATIDAVLPFRSTATALAKIPAGVVANKVFQMRATDDWLRRLDDWRRQQPSIPARAEAIRQLVEIGIEAKGQIKSADTRQARSSRLIRRAMRACAMSSPPLLRSPVALYPGCPGRSG
jgi:hypothetical protein